MSWRSWSGEYIERVVVFHVKHCGVGRFAGWLFESVVSSLLVVGGWCFTWNSCGYGFGVLLGIGDGAFNGVFHVKHDVFTTTHLFHVKRCFCFTTSQGCQCVSRETQGGVVKLLVMVFENSFSCHC